MSDGVERILVHELALLVEALCFRDLRLPIGMDSFKRLRTS